MKLVGGRPARGSKLYRAASVDALTTAGVPVLSMLCAFVYDVSLESRTSWSGSIGG
jgi:hypothetical protein